MMPFAYEKANGVQFWKILQECFDQTLCRGRESIHFLVSTFSICLLLSVKADDYYTSTRVLQLEFTVKCP